MAIKEYSTAYTGASPVQDADPITGVMPDLTDESAPGAGDGDETRTSQVEQPRDKLQAVCKMAGDSATPPTPAGSLAEILDRDHANGDALQLRLRERAGDPTNVANKGFLYTKDVAGVTELFFEDSNGNVLQLSTGGVIGLHASAHKSAGGDPIKIDEFAVGTDVVTLNASLTEHGLLPKLGGGAVNFLRADGTWAAPGGGGFTAYEEEFTAAAGANEFTLSTTPAVNVNTLSGRNILGVFRNGVRSRYQAVATLANEYDQTGGTDRINVVGQSGGEVFTIVFGA